MLLNQRKLAASNRTSHRRRRGETLTYQYDALNRMSVKVVPERAGLASTHTRDVHYGYDLRGFQTEARFDSISGNDRIVTAPDFLGRPVSTTIVQGGVTRTLNFSYLPAGPRGSITHPDATQFTASYDGLNRLTQLREGAAGAYLAGFGYDPLGRLANRNNNLGTAGTSTFTYAPAGPVQSIAHDFASTANDVTLTYAHNPANQITTLTRSNDLYALAVQPPYSRNFTTNGLNQYTAVGAASVTHDANGNIATESYQSYAYDVENRLVGTTVNSSGATTTLTYDPLGRLFQIAPPNAANTRQLLYDGDELVAQYDGSGTLLDRWVHGTAVDDPVVWYSGGSRRFLHADHQGSIVAALDASGNLINNTPNRYDEYGSAASTNIGRFQYTGQIWLPETFTYYYKARMYSPTIGRFLQTDPVGYEGGSNLYGYVGNDPVNGNDPLGLYECRGTSDECAKIKGYAQDLQRAARAARRESGILSQASRLLVRTARYVGTEGDGNGVKIEAGPIEEEGVPANATNERIRIDVARVEAGIAARHWTGAGVLAHEGSHYALYDIRGPLNYRGQSTVLNEVMRREVAGYWVMSYTDQMLGAQTDIWQRDWSFAQRRARVWWAANGSCNSYANAARYEDIPGQVCR